MSSLSAAASTRFITAFDALFEMLDKYPENKRNQPGACGFWSAKDVLSHLCGWADEALADYDAFDAGSVRAVKYTDVDGINAAFVEKYSAFSWDALIAQLHGVAQTLPKRAKKKSRYSMWLAQLARDCEKHTGQLWEFIASEEVSAAIIEEVFPAATGNGLLHKAYPIIEFDDQRTAIIEPSQVLKSLDTMPERVVLCFFQEVIDSVCGNDNAQVIKHLKSEMGQMPVYSLEVTLPDFDDKQRVAVMQPGIGAPLAAGVVEELVALGGKKFIAAGGAGVLDKDIALGNVVVPTSAVRDEGTSYHYLPPSREIAPSSEAVAAIEATLNARNVPYIAGKTWTTDGIYRETPAKIARRRAEGCVTVEMEASAFFAVAQFRDVQFGQLLYGGDDVSGEIWDSRQWEKHTPAREKLFWLAVESVLRL